MAIPAWREERIGGALLWLECSANGIAFGSSQCDCSWICIYVDGKRGFKAEGRAYYLPTQCSIFYSKRRKLVLLKVQLGVNKTSILFLSLTDSEL